MNRHPKLLLLLSILATIAAAQSPTQDPPPAQNTSGAWTDPSTHLLWTATDNAKDVNWSKASKHCRDLRLAGFSDWRLPTIDELQAIYDTTAESPGLGGKHHNQPFTFHARGGLFLTGNPWSSTRIENSHGHPSTAWYFNFHDGGRISDPPDYFVSKRALCVRGSQTDAAPPTPTP